MTGATSAAELVFASSGPGATTGLPGAFTDLVDLVNAAAVDFSGFDFTGFDFSGLTLNGLDFSQWYGEGDAPLVRGWIAAGARAQCKVNWHCAHFCEAVVDSVPYPKP